MQIEFDNIIPFRKKQLFKSASLVDLETGELKSCDIVVENKKIVEITEDSIEDFDGEVVDLDENFVLPSFVNAFSDCEEALENTYGLELVPLEELAKQNNTFAQLYPNNYNLEKPFDFLSGLFDMKSALAGALQVNETKMWPLFKLKRLYLKNLQDFSESELEEISLKAHKEKIRLFIEIGRSLEELGTIDKLYHKPVSEVLEDFGLLEDKPTIVGANCLEKDELELLKNYDCRFITTPYADAKMGRRPLNLAMFKNLDLTMGIGSGSAFEVDFFGYMRQLLTNTWSMFEDKSVLSEKDVFKMATTDGSVAAGMKLQKLQVGDYADFIVVKREVTLYDDVFKTLVWEKSKKDVLMCVMQGKIVQKNGAFQGKRPIDFDEEKKILRKITRRIKNDN